MKSLRDNIEDNAKDKRYGYISLICGILAWVIFNLIFVTISIIYNRKAKPDNKLAKAGLWLSIGYLAVVVMTIYNYWHMYIK